FSCSRSRGAPGEKRVNCRPARVRSDVPFGCKRQAGVPEPQTSVFRSARVGAARRFRKPNQGVGSTRAERRAASEGRRTRRARGERDRESSTRATTRGNAARASLYGAKRLTRSG